MLLWTPAHVEPVGVRELALVAVRGAREEQDA
jgi:hypothetical protein